MLAQGKLLEFGPGAVVFRQGDQGDRFYIVQSGVLGEKQDPLPTPLVDLNKKVEPNPNGPIPAGPGAPVPAPTKN